MLIKQQNLSTKRLDFYEKEIMVDTDCGTAVLRGADIFAPGVLAASASNHYFLDFFSDFFNVSQVKATSMIL